MAWRASLGGAAELAGSGETGGLAGLEYPGAVAVAALRMQMRPGVPLVPAWRAGWCSCGLESQCCCCSGVLSWCRCWRQPAGATFRLHDFRNPPSGGFSAELGCFVQALSGGHGLGCGQGPVQPPLLWHCGRPRLGRKCVVRAVRGHNIEKEAVESEKKLMQDKVPEHLGHSIEKGAVESKMKLMQDKVQEHLVRSIAKGPVKSERKLMQDKAQEHLGHSIE